VVVFRLNSSVFSPQELVHVHGYAEDGSGCCPPSEWMSCRIPDDCQLVYWACPRLAYYGRF